MKQIITRALGPVLRPEDPPHPVESLVPPPGPNRPSEQIHLVQPGDTMPVT